jgi:hypothetical protein
MCNFEEHQMHNTNGIDFSQVANFTVSHPENIITIYMHSGNSITRSEKDLGKKDFWELYHELMEKVPRH